MLCAITDCLAVLSFQHVAPSIPSKPKPCIKLQNLDPIDGSDLSKLETFIFQCSMYILLHKDNFSDKSYQVAFMLSHLKCSTLDWFQSAVVSYRNASITLV